MENLVKEVIDLLDTHAEDLLVTNSSRNGRLTVYQLQDTTSRVTCSKNSTGLILEWIEQ